jgi:hypothetical protein
MSDWTSGSATIHACPPHRVRAVLDTLAEYDLYPENTEDDRRSVNLGASYDAAEFRVGSATDLARELIDSAPEVAFTVYEQPAYEWVGTTCTYVRDLGLFTADCDTCGDPMFTQSEVLRLDDEPAEIRQTALGLPWLTAITAMPGGTVAEPDSYATHWNRTTGEVIVLEGIPCGGDVIFAVPGDAAAVDGALSERAFLRATEWTDLDDTSQIWRTDVYRHPAP